MSIIDDYIAETYNLDINVDYEVVELDAKKLINTNRLDIMAKLLYIESREHNATYGKKIYVEHLRAMTKHSFVEAGNLYKNSPERFIEVFDKIIFSIKKDGFSKNKLPVPIDLNNQILDGAHRVAAAIYFNKKIEVVKLPVKARDKYDYKFFQHMAVNDKYTAEMVRKYIEQKQDIFIANVWPSAVGKTDEIESFINEYGEIIYYKEIYLNEKGAFNYLHQIYIDDSWVGNINNNYSGIYRKQEPCFKNNSPLRVYVIDACFNTDMVALKEKIRALFGIGKHSIHITDTIKQAIQMGQLLFNNNSTDFLNRADVCKCKKSYNLFLREKDNFDDHTAVTSSMVLALSGIREANDIDIISLDKEKYKETHNNLIKYYGDTIENLILNPENYFYYLGTKILSLDIIYAFKKYRNESKDREDLVFIQNFINNEKPKGIKKLSVSLYRARRKIIVKIQGLIIRFTQLTGTYKLAKQIYERMAKKSSDIEKNYKYKEEIFKRE